MNERKGRDQEREIRGEKEVRKRYKEKGREDERRGATLKKREEEIESMTY